MATKEPGEPSAQDANSPLILHVTIGLILLMATLETYIPYCRELGVLKRYLALIFVSAATEMIRDRSNGKHGFDFGIASYLIAFFYPPIFPFVSHQVKQHAADIPILSDLQATLLGTEYTLRFRRAVDFTNIMSEHRAVSDLDLIRSETRRSHNVREGIVCVTFIVVFLLMHGHTGFFVGAATFLLYSWFQYYEDKHETVLTKDVTPINERTGIYAIETTNLWAEHHVGVGYLEHGTFTTKYHVTNGKPITINGRSYPASYYNTETDIVTYGAPPSMVDVADGDEITVALSGPYSDVVVNYTTQVSVNSKGYVVFAGRKSMPGASGSPFFKKYVDKEGKTEYRFAGCIGWALKSKDVQDNEIIEITKNTGIGTSAVIGRGEIVQLITFPGSGKTQDIAKIIQAGLNIYGRVYVGGPTRGVANELVKAYERSPIEGLFPRVLIKDVKRARTPSKLTISTHGTLLGLLLKKDTAVTQPGLWILDESHFPDRNTQALKHYLRHGIATGSLKASLYEMTATAYDIKAQQWTYADASNYPIKDTIMKEEDMVKALMEEQRRAIVFVTAIEGIKQTTSQTLAKNLRSLGKKVIEMNRGNFTTSYPLAKKGDFDVVLTTNIAECGVNLDVDVCYDFQKNPRPLVYRWDDIKTQTDDITIGQLVQRRGRVGRRKEGEYIAPKAKFELTDVRGSDALHVDVALFIKNFDIQAMEPIYGVEEADCIKCTHEQIMYLFAAGEKNPIQSPLTLQLLIDQSGRIRTHESFMDVMNRWCTTAMVQRNRGDLIVTAQYWDDRDSDFYWHWKDVLELRDKQKGTSSNIPMKMRKAFFDLTIAMRKGKTWISRNPTARSELTPEGTDEETESEGEESGHQTSS